MQLALALPVFSGPTGTVRRKRKTAGKEFVSYRARLDANVQISLTEGYTGSCWFNFKITLLPAGFGKFQQVVKTQVDQRIGICGVRMRGRQENRMDPGVPAKSHVADPVADDNAF